MKTRQGYYTEQVRDSSFKEVVNDEKSLNKNCSVVFEVLKSGPKSIYQISNLTGMKEHLVSGRLNDLRKAEYVKTTGRKVLNPISRKENSLWEINPAVFEPKQLKIF
jgi:predicted transcriptional regulator